MLVWDIGIPSVPDYKTRYQLLMRLRCPRLDVNPVLNLVFLPHYAYLIAGCEDGLFAWKVTDLRLEKREREPDMELKLTFDHEVCIDGLAQLSDNALVLKVVESGEIMVFDFASVLERRKGTSRGWYIPGRGGLELLPREPIHPPTPTDPQYGWVCGSHQSGGNNLSILPLSCRSTTTSSDRNAGTFTVAEDGRNLYQRVRSAQFGCRALWGQRGIDLDL